MANLTTKITHIISGDVVSKGIAFFLTIYLTRVLGVDGFGMVTVALAFVGYGTFFGDFGLFTIGTREVAKSADKRVFQPFELLIARMVLATLVFFILWFSLPYIISNGEQLVLTRRYLFAMLIHAYLVEWYFNGSQRYDLIAISRSIQTGVYALGAILLVKNPSDILHLPIFYVIGYFISAILLLSLAFRNKAFTFSTKGIALYKKLLKSSSSIGTGLLFSNVIQLLPPITIGIFLSTADAGLYGAAYRLIIIGMLIDRLFVQLLVPNLARLWVNDKERATINIEHTSRIMLTVGGVISIFIAVGASELSSFLFGDSFIDSAVIISVLSLFLFFTFQNSIFSHGLLAIGKDVDFLKATSYGGSMAIILILVSSIYFNSTMVGLAVAVSELLIAALCFHWFSKSMSFSYIKPFLFTLMLGLGIYLGSTQVDFNPILKAILASGLFGLLLLAFRVFRVQDVKWLKSILLK